MIFEYSKLNYIIKAFVSFPFFKVVFSIFKSSLAISDGFFTSHNVFMICFFMLAMGYFNGIASFREGWIIFSLYRFCKGEFFRTVKIMGTVKPYMKRYSIKTDDLK